jgi:hypothetical protein
LRVVRTFVDITYTTGGASPAKVFERLFQVHDLTFVKGPHDVVFHWQTPKEFWDYVTAIHNALNGTGVNYRLETIDDEAFVPELSPWVGSFQQAEEAHPGFDRKSSASKPPAERIP